MPFKPGNLPLAKLKKLLVYLECKCIREQKGHEKWARQDLLRPITFQNHIDPVPEFIVKQIMRTLNLSNADMEKIMKNL